MSSLKSELKAQVQALATANVFIGTSSWKYEGWRGMLYDERRYMTRNKFSTKRFNETCLEEYAEVFKTVCVDAGYYKFPDERYLAKLVAQVPEDFKFAFKVTDEITVKNFTNLPRYGARAGQPNLNFLNPDLFTRAFLGPCEAFKRNIGLLMFEFSQFHERDFAHGRDFVAALDTFLSRLPRGWQYGVEIRNKTFLKHDEYFEMLRRHGVTHVFSSWSRMPPVSEQIAIEHSQTVDFLAARFLLTPGMGYDNAVKSFSPYTETKVVNEDARNAGKALIEKARRISKLPSYVFINNRLEGNALRTIEAMLALEYSQPATPQRNKAMIPSVVTYPAYWLARLSLVDAENRVPLMVFRAVYEVTENIVKTYSEEPGSLDFKPDEGIPPNCLAAVKNAAQEFADAHYGVNNLGHAYDYHFCDVEQITSIGLELEHSIFTAKSGVKVWLQDEEHPEQ